MLKLLTVGDVLLGAAVGLLVLAWRGHRRQKFAEDWANNHVSLARFRDSSKADRRDAR